MASAQAPCSSFSPPEGLYRTLKDVGFPNALFFPRDAVYHGRPHGSMELPLEKRVRNRYIPGIVESADPSVR